MPDLIHYLDMVPVGFWQLLLAAAIVAPLTQGLKKWLDIQKSHHAFILLVIVSAVAAGVEYLKSTPSNNPSIIVAHTALTAFTAQPFYYIFIKGFWQGVVAPSLPAARSFNEMIKTSRVPSDGLEIAGTSLSTIEAQQAELNAKVAAEDFST
jgi:hypothetical protein